MNRIRTVINQMSLPNSGTLHMYFPTKEDAQRESFRSGRPYFKSIKDGVEMYSVRLTEQ